MKKTIERRPESGFTLIELVVVIVVLAILAATALPRFAGMSTDARIAKMRAAEGAVKSGAALFHAAWLAAGSPIATAGNSDVTNSVILLEGQRIAFNNGYPDVGGDGAFDSATATTISGIVMAAGGLTDYLVDTSVTHAGITITPDVGHPNCMVVYYEPVTTGSAPIVDSVGINSTNGPINCL